jgi:hypothetical protein
MDIVSGRQSGQSVNQLSESRKGIGLQTRRSSGRSMIVDNHPQSVIFLIPKLPDNFLIPPNSSVFSQMLPAAGIFLLPPE